MPYTREELDWIEAEWAYHLHGRSAFLSREDFAQLQKWDGEGVQADAVIGAMEAYFQRRAKRAKVRSFVALSHLERDVAKAMKLREALRRTETEIVTVVGWDAVAEPLRSDPKARLAFEAWRRLQISAPLPDNPGYLDHFDLERTSFRTFVELAEAALGNRGSELQADLLVRLQESKIPEGSVLWKRAWEHHWSRAVCEAWGVQP
ncbi:MAG: hypothetical protein Q8O00_05415 [Holophaga sp.]|nr:hypothetical protein [Holophaga sp.]